MRTLRCRPPYEAWECTVCGAGQDRPPASYLSGLACETCVDRGLLGEPFIPLTVRPVGPPKRLEDRLLIAVSVRDGLVLTEHGETFPLSELPDRIRERDRNDHREAPGRRGRFIPAREMSERLPSGFVVTDAGLDLVAFLDNSPAGEPATWQLQVGLRSASAWRPEPRRTPARHVSNHPKAVRFGYASRADGRRRAKGRAVWWEVLDVHEFCQMPTGFGDADCAELLRFGLALREWANRERLPLLPSAAAYGSRLLRDARFGGGWRRKVPAATNRQIRRRLPGNHYQLLTAAGRTIERVHKLDQAAAHHNAALRVQFPGADRLWAAGWYRQPPPREGSKCEHEGAIVGLSDRWHELISRPGMFVAAVHAGERVAIDPLMIPALRRPGTTWRTLTSVEVAHIRRLQTAGHPVGIGDIWCCWTSPDVDERLNEYACWSLGQTAGAPAAALRWLKPTLLAAYGLLAASPRRFRNAWRHAARPQGGIGFQTRYGPLVGYERSTLKAVEPATANVIWRALIEAHVRLESLTFAQRLRADGFRPVAVYADAVFATGDGQPAAPPPWRYEGVLSDLIFETPARYRAREEVRLPGTPTRQRAGLQRALSARRTA